MQRRATRLDARLGLLLAVVGLLPGVLVVLAAGSPVAVGPTLALTEAAAALSLAALQGADGPPPELIVARDTPASPEATGLVSPGALAPSPLEPGALVVAACAGLCPLRL